MMINDPLSDMIARIRNAHMRKRSKVLTPASRLRQRVLDVLQDEGYIRGYALVQNPGEFPQFEIELKYFDGQPVIAEIARVSKPGRRVYSAISDLKPIKNGLGISILSTGHEGFGTPSGSFKIQQKDRDHVSSRFGDYVSAATGEVIKKDIDRNKDPMPKGAKYDGAKMPFFMRVSGGVGMHEGFLPGYPASHGCIRMPAFMAEAFFNNVSVGTPVNITP